MIYGLIHARIRPNQTMPHSESSLRADWEMYRRVRSLTLTGQYQGSYASGADFQASPRLAISHLNPPYRGFISHRSHHFRVANGNSREPVKLL